MKENETLALLEIKRTFKADQQTVFNALTQPEIMADWFYGMEEGSAKIESDFRVGGEYVIEMFGKDGGLSGCADHAPHGSYLEIDPPNRVAFTWISEGFVDYSVVTITLTPVEGGTELTLRHELPEQVVPQHREGWNTCLGHLETNCFSD